MAKLRYAIPGVGGSLGSCAVCGETFLEEILLGKRVDCINIAGINADLPVHTKCAGAVIALQGKWEDVRDKFPKGPLYNCFEEQYSEKVEAGNGK